MQSRSTRAAIAIAAGLSMVIASLSPTMAAMPRAPQASPASGVEGPLIKVQDRHWRGGHRIGPRAPRRYYNGHRYRGHHYRGRHYRDRHYRYGRHYYRHRNRNSIGAGVAGLGLGLALGSAMAQPRYYAAPPAYAGARPAPWSREWYAYCASKYRSFDPRSGTFQPYNGPRRLCR
ncbi:BA14K family protein [Afifella sp. H1R]|uniref:BA14K family protein n=1 Tax=Afifella sp. H1R TaxID=2908841 RepID=UPI001F31E77D|nr:BA14K family protein [Afifella sp. H1R]MCF1503196.1 BA14K family protein [Afifella sp. H1R]